MSVPITLASAGSIGFDDRAFNYGDGVFETIRVHAGRPVWWEPHWARLTRGATALAIECPSSAAVLAAAQPLLQTHRNGVLKLLLSRGGGGRGYALPAEPHPHLLLSWHPLPSPPPSQGLQLRWCDLRLGLQPRLAGLKHCNRLEQILARAEWCDPAVHEGLLCDSLDAVTCATSANLFVCIDGCWHTPLLDRCGVAGICRGWLLDVRIAREARLSRAEVESAEALFLCNAVRGILPVAGLGARRFAPHAPTHRIMQRLAEAEPAFATTEA